VIVAFAAKGKNNWAVSRSGKPFAEVILSNGEATATILRPLNPDESVCLSAFMKDVREGRIWG
jgi:hypothetical protein